MSALLLWLESEVRSGHDAPAEVQHWVEWRNNEHEWLGRGQYYQHHGYTVLAVRGAGMGRTCVLLSTAGDIGCACRASALRRRFNYGRNGCRHL